MTARYGTVFDGGKRRVRRAMNDTMAAGEIKRICTQGRGVTRKAKREKIREVYFKIEELRSGGSIIGEKTYTAGIAVMGRLSAPDHAFALWKKMLDSNTKPTPVTYSTILSALASQPGTLDSSIQVWKEMRQEGIKPDTKHYNTLIHVHHLNSKLTSCEEIARAMDRDNVSRNIFTYGILLGAARNRMKRNELLERMIYENLRPTTEVMNTSLKGCLEETAEPWALFNKMTLLDAEPNISTFNTLISVFRDRREVHRALKVVDHITVPYDHFTYNSLLSCCLSLVTGPSDAYHRFSLRLADTSRASGLYTDRSALLLLKIHAKLDLVDDATSIYYSSDTGPGTRKQMLTTLFDLYNRNKMELPKQMAETIKKLSS
eukprot:TRINITY_DN9381_c0_g2_i1.p1 TRINITY_DN9381_c0_g2~~TRINITY_DN9381_c0_g2_i1.p1  ORF type:complete len:375 (+),score=44.66 TRINITY_DN9381_c0_g2_i1:148-1272(+)